MRYDKGCSVLHESVHTALYMALGTGAVGGMLIGTLCQIFIVPVLFVIFEYFQEKVKPIKIEGLDTSDVETELEQYAKPTNKEE